MVEWNGKPVKRVRSSFRSAVKALRGRDGAKKAICVVAAAMLTAICHMLKNGTEHQDHGTNHFDRRFTEIKARFLPPGSPRSASRSRPACCRKPDVISRIAPGHASGFFSVQLVRLHSRRGEGQSPAICVIFLIVWASSGLARSTVTMTSNGFSCRSRPLGATDRHSDRRFYLCATKAEEGRQLRWPQVC
jgi:hypothetical protein